MSGMVERVAKAIAGAHVKNHATYEDMARAAIEAMREPDQRMLDASWNCTREVLPDERMKVMLMNTSMAHRVKTLNRWRAMIAAALSASSGEMR